MKISVLLDSGTVGYMDIEVTTLDECDFLVGMMATVSFHDENGMETTATGKILEILEGY